ncbi:MAG: hypothetical protein K9H49_01155 [Bacteroidales bacterium]|nr:hypothetical protein [Bacteroidales bacterium]MCF8403805.1 hypothetical protein [Bacteroidales bacterium]
MRDEIYLRVKKSRERFYQELKGQKPLSIPTTLSYESKPEEKKVAVPQNEATLKPTIRLISWIENIKNYINISFSRTKIYNLTKPFQSGCNRIYSNYNEKRDAYKESVFRFMLVLFGLNESQIVELIYGTQYSIEDLRKTKNYHDMFHSRIDQMKSKLLSNAGFLHITDFVSRKQRTIPKIFDKSSNQKVFKFFNSIKRHFYKSLGFQFIPLRNKLE